MLIAPEQVQIVAPPAPPAYGAPAQTNAPLAERVKIAVVIRAGGQTLYDGALWVSPRGQAAWQLSVQEAPDPMCQPDVGNTRTNELSIRISSTRYGSYANAGLYAVTVRWQRPGETACEGVRTVELREAVNLANTPIVLKGDGGLTVEIRRR